MDQLEAETAGGHRYAEKTLIAYQNSVDVFFHVSYKRSFTDVIILLKC
jgi:hypothetical protein